MDKMNQTEFDSLCLTFHNTTVNAFTQPFAEVLRTLIEDNYISHLIDTKQSGTWIAFVKGFGEGILHCLAEVVFAGLQEAMSLEAEEKGKTAPDIHIKDLQTMYENLANTLASVALKHLMKRSVGSKKYISMLKESEYGLHKKIVREFEEEGFSPSQKTTFQPSDN